MAFTVKVAEAKTHLPELPAKVEAGEEVIIFGGNTPIAPLSPHSPRNDTLIAEIRAMRASAKPATQDKIRATKAAPESVLHGRRFYRCQLVPAGLTE